MSVHIITRYLCLPVHQRAVACNYLPLQDQSALSSALADALQAAYANVSDASVFAVQIQATKASR